MRSISILAGKYKKRQTINITGCSPVRWDSFFPPFGLFTFSTVSSKLIAKQTNTVGLLFFLIVMLTLVEGSQI